MEKTIVVFSNPFGYGPSAAATAVLEALQERNLGANAVFAGSGLCMEMMGAIPIRKDVIDERSSSVIAAYLKTIENPYVIASQNRFAVHAAKELSIPCAYIDTLAWFWKEMPADHLSADEIFWPRIPDIESKVPQNSHNVHIVSGIVAQPPPSARTASQLLIHVGGAKYPFSKDVPRQYLALIAACADAIASTKSFERVLCAGGADAMAYVGRLIQNKRVVAPSLPRHEFQKQLASSVRVLTTAGMFGTLEAFSANIPTAFLPSLNLSQDALLRLLEKYAAAPCAMKWEKYVAIDPDFYDLNEKDAIVRIERYAEITSADSSTRKKFIDDCISLTLTDFDSAQQSYFANLVGSSGANEIADILITTWML